MSCRRREEKLAKTAHAMGYFTEFATRGNFSLWSKFDVLCIRLVLSHYGRYGVESFWSGEEGLSTVSKKAPAEGAEFVVHRCRFCRKFDVLEVSAVGM